MSHANSRLNALYNIIRVRGEDNQSADSNGNSPPKEITFTPEQQEKINSIQAAEKRKFQDQLKKVEDELTKSKDAIKDRESLTKELDELKRSLMTKEELAKADAEKKQNEFTTQLTEAKASAESYKNLFENTLVKQEIAKAASKHKAFSPTQLELLLLGQAKVVPTIEDGKVTGFEVKAPVKVKDKILELNIDEAVAKLRDNTEFANLFLVDGNPGSGNRTLNTNPGSVDFGSKPPTDPAAYREWRAKQGIKK